ncbi:MAG: hypothetical protein CBC09_08455 [Cellvibrionales bacterium TMED49]|nr:MAG: hypothetical protein CBC09_08455 [Cellvibrionales bacterium TMED49]|tara:strand:+ start:1398 stop:1727 length:330 start_codon:yes stop_codon:yes gene_type:complete
MVTLILLFGCAGKTAQPIRVIEITDSSLTCSQLLSQIYNLERSGAELAGQTDKQGKNAALAVAGSFVIVPYFFMDLKEGEAVELNAVRARHMHLSKLYQSNQCGDKPRS